MKIIGNKAISIFAFQARLKESWALPNFNKVGTVPKFYVYVQMTFQPFRIENDNSVKGAVYVHVKLPIEVWLRWSLL